MKGTELRTSFVLHALWLQNPYFQPFEFGIKMKTFGSKLLPNFPLWKPWPVFIT